MIALGGHYLARIRGPHWQITPGEAAELSAALAAVMVYIPLPTKELGIAVALGQLATALFMIAWPRLEMDAALAQQRETAAAVQAAQGIVGQGGGTAGWNGA